MSNSLALAFSVLTKNSSEIAEIVNKLGGFTNVVRVLPQLYTIMQTISAHNAETPAEAMPMQYGSATFAKVKAFQAAHNLDDDGIVGDKTWAAVEKALAGKK